jgi:hypothetical protein
VKYYIDRRDANPFRATTFRLSNMNLCKSMRTEFIMTALDALALRSSSHSDNSEGYLETAVFTVSGKDAQGSVKFLARIMTDRQWAAAVSKLKGVCAVVASFLNESCTASDLLIYSKPR